MTKFRIALCAAAAVLLSAGASRATNLIANGDFETGSLAPWGVFGSIEDVTESQYGPCCGFTTTHPDNHVATFGAGRGTGNEVLSQSFADVAGVSYTLNYDWAFIGAQANNLIVIVGGVSHIFCCSGSTDIDAAYAHDTISFVGTGLDSVTFSVQSNPLDSTDTIIDNVTVGVPEPATWALMIGGFGLAGAALRRRRTVAA
jgi:major type 1 subunit fimbrin (pilin)